jgi:hypothetical protein
VSSSCYAYYLRRICYQPGPSRTGTRRDNLHSLFLTVTLNEAIHSDIFHLHLSEISTPPFSQRSNIVEIFTCTKARPSHLARAYALRGSCSQKVHRNQSSVLSNCRMDDASEETEVSAMVTPNQLCDVCQRVTGTSITLVIWTFDTHNTEQVIQSTPADDTLPFLYTYIPHHASIEALLASAKQGCHLCSLFTNEASFGSECTDSQLFVTSHPERSVRKEYRQTIVLRLRPSWRGKLSPFSRLSEVRMHRHCCGSSPESCPGQNTLQDRDSVDFKAEWLATTVSTLEYEMLTK